MLPDNLVGLGRLFECNMFLMGLKVGVEIVEIILFVFLYYSKHIVFMFFFGHDNDHFITFDIIVVDLVSYSF
jgi:hypothetical protein